MKLLCLIYGRIYRKWLWSDYFQDYDKVIKVFGWRKALVEDRAKRRRIIWPCFWGLK